MATPSWREGILLAIAAALGGCASGRNFQEPSQESLVLGVTTRSEILERFGTPQKEGEVLKDGATLRTFSYAYARHRDLGGAHARGVVPARALTLTFLENGLVGHSFTSSFEDDHTDFDETKLGQIKKGVSTRADVIALLGPPRGKCIYPLAAGKDQEGIIYNYIQYYKGFAKVKISTKRAVVTFDRDDVVVHVESTVSE